MPGAQKQKLIFLILSCALFGQAHGQCYLMDSAAECPVCWKTVYSSKTDTMGITTMDVCPDTIKLSWNPPPPKELIEYTEYDVGYMFWVNSTTFPVVHPRMHASLPVHPQHKLDLGFFDNIM